MHKRLFSAIVSMLLFLCAYATDDFVVVIDAGHGGKDVGAVDNGVKEKDINLGVAQHLEELIKKRLKNVKVVMTRDHDTYLTLQQRADKANKSKGDLFISIHTNSVDKSNKNRTTVAGASTYALGLHKDKSNMEVARRENSVMTLEKNFEKKYSGFDPDSDESYIVFEMSQKGTLNQSIKFADEVQKQLSSVAGRKDRGVHQAGFWVLWATAMPAVLIEIDFICNPNSAKFISSSSGQKKLADAICRAVKNYKENKLSPSKSFSSSNIEDPTVDAVLETWTPDEKKIGVPKNQQVVSQSRRRRRSDAARKTSAERDIEIAKMNTGSKQPNNKIPENSIKAGIDQGGGYTQSTNNNSNESKNGTKQNNKKHTKKAEKKNDLSSTVRLNKKKTVYKIQILASTERLKSNNPRFCGLSPISCIKENDLFKYTYGETDDKSEIDRILKIVKQKIPDAFIIKIRKGTKTIIK